MNSNSLVYLRVLYRLPVLALSALACFLYARVTGNRNACRVWAALASRVCRRELVITGAPPDPAARLIVANHVSHVDLIPIFYLWPACLPVAMREIRSWFFIGWLLRKSAIFVDEEDLGSRRGAREEMRKAWSEGRTVLVFPEGIIARRRHRFSAGSFQEAIASGIAIQGARISYSPELLASLGGELFEERFFWVLCQNFQIRVTVFPAEADAGDPAALTARWEKRLLAGEQPAYNALPMRPRSRGRPLTLC